MLVTFLGVFLTAASRCTNSSGKGRDLFRTRVLPAFAAGALLATTGFLLIPEAIELLSTEQVASTEHSLAVPEQYFGDKLPYFNGSGIIDTRVANVTTFIPATDTSEGNEDSTHLKENKSEDAFDDLVRRSLRVKVKRWLQDESPSTPNHGGSSFEWKFGTSLLGGFLVPLLLSAIFSKNECEEPLPSSDDTALCREEIRKPGERGSKDLLNVDVKNEDAETLFVKDETAIRKEEIKNSGERGAKDFPNVDVTSPSAYEADAFNHHRIVIQTLTMEKAPSNDNETSAKHGPSEIVIDEACCSKVNSDEEEIKVELVSDELHSPEVELPAVKKAVNMPLVLSILLGDFFHNFTDGIFIGNALILCSRDIAFTMVATTIYHEIAQELADFVLLTTQGGLNVWQALMLNFLAGTSVMIGAVVILALDLNTEWTGCILAVAAGVYLNITTVECVAPSMANCKHHAKESILFVLCFFVGAAPIGLVLLNHEHCGN